MVTERDFSESAKWLGVEIISGPPEPDEWYLAGKYNQVHLFRCAKVENGRVYPKPQAYPFKIEDCRRIRPLC